METPTIKLAHKSLEQRIIDAMKDGPERQAILDSLNDRTRALEEALHIIREARGLTSNMGTFAHVGGGAEGFVYTDPLTLRMEAFFQLFPIR